MKPALTVYYAISCVKKLIINIGKRPITKETFWSEWLFAIAGYIDK